MPYVEGDSLRTKLAREGELPIPDAIRVLRDVVDALAFAHQHGVVHRDIKPDNVLVLDRHAVVTDFGVAKAVNEATGRGALTSVGVALGTPAYMAPEQASADPNTDHRADIYAVGAMGAPFQRVSALARAPLGSRARAGRRSGRGARRAGEAGKRAIVSVALTAVL